MNTLDTNFTIKNQTPAHIKFRQAYLMFRWMRNNTDRKLASIEDFIRERYGTDVLIACRIAYFPANRPTAYMHVQAARERIGDGFTVTDTFKDTFRKMVQRKYERRVKLPA